VQTLPLQPVTSLPRFCNQALNVAIASIFIHGLFIFFDNFNGGVVNGSNGKDLLSLIFTTAPSTLTAHNKKSTTTTNSSRSSIERPDGALGAVTPSIKRIPHHPSQ